MKMPTNFKVESVEELFCLNVKFLQHLKGLEKKKQMASIEASIAAIAEKAIDSYTWPTSSITNFDEIDDHFEEGKSQVAVHSTVALPGSSSSVIPLEGPHDEPIYLD